MKENIRYIAFLRGINVGGHHKLPMADLKEEMLGLGFEEVETLLNSGNVIFSAPQEEETAMEQRIVAQLEARFGFPVPVLLRTAEQVLELYAADPFRGVEVHHDIRLYVSFLKQIPQPLELPWVSEDDSFRIIRSENRSVCSVLDLSVTPSPKAMDALERIFGKNITTRNWNTIEKIAERLKP